MPRARFSNPHRVLAVAFVGMASLHGARTAFAILLPFLTADLGLSLTEGTLIFWLNWAVYAVTSIGLGVLVDRDGLRRWIFAVGGLLLSSGLGAMALVTSGWQAAIAFGVVAAGGSALVGNVPSNVVAVTALPDRAGMAVGVVNSGVGVGSAIFPLIVGAALHHGGWRSAWAVASLAVAAPLLILLATIPPFEPVAHPTPHHQPSTGLWSIVGSWTYWGLFLAFALALVAQHGALVHLPNAGIERGVSPAVVSFGLGIVGVASVVGRLIFGAAMDRARDPAVIAIPASGLFVAGVAVAAHMRTANGYLISAGLLGLGVAAYGPLWGNLVRARFSDDVLARAFGLLMLGAGLGGSAGPVIMSRMVEMGSGYTAAFYGVGAAATLAVPFFFVRSRPGVEVPGSSPPTSDRTTPTR